jgi:hypothetical protein
MANYCLVVCHPSGGLYQPDDNGCLATEHARNFGLGADEVHGTWGMKRAFSTVKVLFFQKIRFSPRIVV